MKKALLIAVIVFLTLPLFAQDANNGGEVYIVQSGDTLWGLAQQFYHNPWLWPRIWEANPYIDDPNLIYPGKPLAIPKILSGPPPQNLASATAVTGTRVPQPIKPVTGVSVPPPVESLKAPPVTPSVQQAPAAVATPLPSENLPPAPTSPQVSAGNVPAPQEVATMPEEIEEPTVQTIVIPQPPPIHYFIRVGYEGFISKYELKSYGRIVASDSEKVLYSQGDYLYINMGESAGIIPGDKFVVFEMQEPVFSPRYRRKIGYLVRIKGVLEVKEVFKDTAKVYVTKSYDAIMIGDSIKPFEKFPHHIEIKKSEANVDGYIIATIDNRNAVGEGDVVYLDIGKRDNVEIGNVVEIYQPARKVYDPIKSRYEHIPPLLVGKAIILSVQDRTSVALIFRSYKEIYRNYKVRMVAQY